MNVEDLYEFCLTIKDAEATLPFDDVTLVMKVMGKMFAMIPLDSDRLCITLKCDPRKAVALREKYRCVEPAYYMNKTYWNCIYITGEMSDAEVKSWICHSADEVVKKLPKKQQLEYYGSTK